MKESALETLQKDFPEELRRVKALQSLQEQTQKEAASMASSFKKVYEATKSTHSGAFARGKLTLVALRWSEDQMEHKVFMRRKLVAEPALGFRRAAAFGCP